MSSGRQPRMWVVILTLTTKGRIIIEHRTSRIRLPTCYLYLGYIASRRRRKPLCKHNLQRRRCLSVLGDRHFRVHLHHPQTVSTRSTRRTSAYYRCDLSPADHQEFSGLIGVTFQFASHSITYSFNKNNGPRDKDSFGIETGGRVMLVPFDKFNELIARMSHAYAVA
jgi:hypothetical protein